MQLISSRLLEIRRNCIQTVQGGKTPGASHRSEMRISQQEKSGNETRQLYRQRRGRKRGHHLKSWGGEYRSAKGSASMQKRRNSTVSVSKMMGGTVELRVEKGRESGIIQPMRVDQAQSAVYIAKESRSQAHCRQSSLESTMPDLFRKCDDHEP